MKNQKGITLVALVVTIIVLLILAGVTIAMLTGENGILTNAKQAKSENAIAEAREVMGLAYSAVYTQIQVELAGDQAYDATKDTADLQEIVNKQCTEAAGYSSEIVGSTIVITYTNSAIDRTYSTEVTTSGQVTGTIDLSEKTSATFTFNY